MISVCWAKPPSQVVMQHDPANKERPLATLSRPLASPGWRLLTGHENGQCLLWHPMASHLAPLLMIGEPMSPCRGIVIFEQVRYFAFCPSPSMRWTMMLCFQRES